MKKLIIYGVVFIVLIVGAVGVVALIDHQMKIDEINSPEGRYYMEISGRANYGFAGIAGWSITEITYTVQKMNVDDLSVASILAGFWPWESDDVTMKCRLSNSLNTYVDSYNVGILNVYLGESKTWKCTITMIRPSTIEYDLLVSLNEGNLAQKTEIIENIKIG